MTTATARQPQDSELFELKAAHVMQSLREAFLGVIEALPQPPQRAADLEKSLKLSRTLAWQVYRIATNDNPLASAAHVPGSSAVRQALRSARSAGVAQDRLRDAAAAMDAFEALIDEHAGDRATLTTMIDSLAGGESEGVDLKTRRQAFRVNSQVWGVQVKTFLACGIIHPGSDSSFFDMSLLRGLRDIRRLRPDTPLRLSSQRIVDAHRGPTEPHPLAADDNPNAPGPNLLLDFCTKPCPELDTRIEDGCIHTFLRETPLGKAGVQTLYLADITRGIEGESQDALPNHHIRSATIMKPIEALVLDTLIHRDMYGSLTPQVKVYGSLDRLGETDPYKYRDQETLPIPAEVRNLGYGLGVLPTPHVPRYREMVQRVCDDAGWDANEFEVFRCVIEYPMLNTMVQVRFDLPERGNW